MRTYRIINTIPPKKDISSFGGLPISNEGPGRNKDSGAIHTLRPGGLIGHLPNGGTQKGFPMIQLDGTIIAARWMLTWFKRSGESYTTDPIYESRESAERYGNSTLRYLRKRPMPVVWPNGYQFSSTDISHFIAIPYVEGVIKKDPQK